MDSREQEIAVMEANMAHDSNAYFTARHEMLDTRERRVLFDSAYKRAWQACQSLNDKRIGGDISEWLKEDETVIQRLERERKDSASNLKLFADERLKVEQLEAKLKVASEAFSDISKLAGTQEFAHFDIVIAKNIAFSTHKQLTEE